MLQTAEYTSERIIRVFISSTFQDMQAERDELTLRVFPELRARCRDRGITLIDVDLRWGITEEQERKGELLPAILKQINLSRPYFIGLLGERYGTVPASIDEKLFDKYPWLKHHSDRSLTELEILHGALLNTMVSENVLFYFRSLNYINQIPDAEREKYMEGNPEKAMRQKSLKDRILKEGFKNISEFDDPGNLGDRVLSDLWELIDHTFPQNQPPKINLLENNKAKYQLQYLADEVYIDRVEEQLLNEFMDTGMGCLGLVSSSGYGKTALLAYWTKRFFQTHPNYFIFEHYLADIRHGASVDELQHRLLKQIKLEAIPDIDIPNTSVERLQLIHIVLKRLQEKIPVLFVIDGLENLVDNNNKFDLDFLQVNLPARVKIICSMRPGLALEAVKRRGWRTILLGDLSYHQRDAIIVRYLERFGKQLSPDRRHRIAEHPLATNPLFLRSILEELRVGARHDILNEKITEYLEVEDLSQLFDVILRNFETRLSKSYPGMLRHVMVLLWASRQGLLESEILNLLDPANGQITQHFWSIVLLSFQESLVIQSGRVRFRHEYLKDAVIKRYLNSPKQLAETHNELITYFQNCAKDQRTVEELSWQYYTAKRLKDLKELISNPKIFHLLWSNNKQHDLLIYFVALDKEEDFANIMLESANKFYQKENFVKEHADHLEIVGHFLESIKRSKDAISFYIDALTRLIEVVGWDNERIADCHKYLANAQFGASEYSTATLTAHRALALYIKLHGFEHEKVAHTLMLIAMSVAKTNPQSAKDLFHKALSINIKVCGSDHSSTAIMMDNMANTLSQTEDKSDVLTLHREALAISERTFGPDHIETAKCMDNLARELNINGEYIEAEKLARRALYIFDQQVGEDHPDSFVALHHLGIALVGLEDIAGAAEVYRRKLLSLRVTDGMFKETLNEMKNLAAILYNSGHRSEAELVLRDCVNVLDSFGKTVDPALLLPFGLLMYEQGMFNESEKLYQRAMNNPESKEWPYEKVWVRALTGLAKIKKDRGDLKQAIEFLEEALELCNETTSDMSFDEMECHNLLTTVLLTQGKLEAADNHSFRALEISEKEYGKDSANVAIMYDLRGRVLLAQDELDPAEKMLRQAIKILKREIGDDHPNTLSALNNLAVVRFRRSDLDEAVTLLQEVAEIRTRVFGESHPNNINTLFLLGEVLEKKGDQKKAEQIYLRIKEMYDQFQGEGIDIVRCLFALAQCQENQSNIDEAEMSYRELLNVQNNQTREFPSHLKLTVIEKLFGYVFIKNKFEEAENFARQAIDLVSSNRDINSFWMGFWQRALANLLTVIGEHKQASIHYQIAVRTFQEELGDKHENTLNTIELYKHNQQRIDAGLGAVVSSLLHCGESCLKSNNLVDAEKWITRALSICNEALGGDDPLTGIALSDLAALYILREQFTEAIAIYRRCLQMSIETKGERDVNTEISYKNLANAYAKNGEFEEAIQLYRKALDIIESEERQGNKDSFTAYQQLTKCLLRLKRENEASDILVRAIKKNEVLFNDVKGGEATVLFLELTSIFKEQTSYTAEEHFLISVIDIAPQTSGFWWLLGGLVFYNLAMIYSHIGKPRKAIEFFEKVLESETCKAFIQPELLDSDQELPELPLQWAAGSLLYLTGFRDIPEGKWDQVVANHGLACKLLRRNGNEAEALYAELNLCGAFGKAEIVVEITQVRELIKKIGVPDNPRIDIIYSINELAVYFRRLGKLDDAEYLAMYALALDEKIQNITDSNIEQSLNNLTIILLLKGKLEEAMKFNTRAWKVSIQKHDAIITRILIIRIALGIIMKREFGDYLGQLRSLLKADYDSVKKIIRGWKIDDILDLIRQKSSDENTAFFTLLIEVLHNQERLSELEGWEIWSTQIPISLDVPWPSRGY